MKFKTTQLLVAVLLHAVGMSALAQSAHYTRYDESLATIGQVEVVQSGHTGAGAAIAQLEGNILNWNFVEDDGVNPPEEIFGGCSRPAGAKDHLGWVPNGESCKLAWVMCVKVNSAGIRRECTLSSRPADYSNHATVVAKGLVSTAPGAKIVALGMQGSIQLSFREGMRWLYTPGSSHTSAAMESSDPQGWLDYWDAEFGNQTPAQRFNIVSANMSNTVGYGLYSRHCEAINPAIPQTNSDSDLFIDIEDNCTNVHNEYLQDYYSDSGFYIGSWLIQRDTDEDGYGNMCDGDLNNDGIANWVDGIILNSRLGTDDPDADFNGDGIVNDVDRSMLLNDMLNLPPGPAAVDLNATLDAQNLRDPAKYIQDYRYAYNLPRLDTADEFSFVDEIAGLRAAGIAPVIAAGNVTAMNAVAAPACTEGAIAVSGIRADWQDQYPATTGSIGSSVSPTLTSIVAPAQIIDDPTDADPLPKFGAATSFAAPVVAASIAILRAPDVNPYATVEETLQRLQTTGDTAHEFRNCNPGQDVLASDPSAVPVPEREPPSLWCPEGTETSTYEVNYTRPLLNLSAAVDDALIAAQNVVDTDGDGVPDTVDNCILAANGPLIPDAGGYSQRDTDGDGYGNICDADLNNDGIVMWYDGVIFTKALGTADPDSDLNGDGIVDSNDTNIVLGGLLNNPPGPSALAP